jgi:hypothetical protein
VSGVLGAPHDPDRSTSERTGKGEHLNTSVALERIGRNDAVFDRLSGTGTDSDGAYHLEDGAENHSLAVGNRAGRNRGSPCVSDIVWELLAWNGRRARRAVLTSTVVVGIEERKEGTDGEHIVVLVELRHSCWCSLLAAGSW